MRNLLNQVFENKTERPGGHYTDGKKGIGDSTPFSEDLGVLYLVNLSLGTRCWCFGVDDVHTPRIHPLSSISPK